MTGWLQFLWVAWSLVVRRWACACALMLVMLATNAGAAPAPIEVCWRPDYLRADDDTFVIVKDTKGWRAIALTMLLIQNFSRRHTKLIPQVNLRAGDILVYTITSNGRQYICAKSFYPRIPEVQHMRSRALGVILLIGATLGCSDLPRPQEQSELRRVIDARRAIACATGSRSSLEGPTIQVRDVVANIDRFDGVNVRVSGILRVTDRGRGELYNQEQDFLEQRSDPSLEVPATDVINWQHVEIACDMKKVVIDGVVRRLAADIETVTSKHGPSN